MTGRKERATVMEIETICYCFTLGDGTQEIFNLRLDTEHLELRGNTPENLPEWTRLEFHQCPHCPLTPETHPHCPLAANLVNIVSRFDGLLSHDDLRLDVITKERLISQDTTAQRGISSLMGLLIATSGCPHTAFFRPMARFHLPLSTKEETAYRATSMYMLAQYFLNREGKDVDLELDGLREIYRNMQKINASIIERLRSATETDSTVNAIIVLDIHAKTMEVVLKESLEDIRHMFDPFFERVDNLDRRSASI